MLAFKRKLKRRNPASVCPSWVFVCGRNGSQQARTNAEKRSEAPQSAREAAKPNDICCLTASGGGGGACLRTQRLQVSGSSCTDAGKRGAERRTQRRARLEDSVVVSLHGAFASSSGCFWGVCFPQDIKIKIKGVHACRSSKDRAFVSRGRPDSPVSMLANAPLATCPL